MTDRPGGGEELVRRCENVSRRLNSIVENRNLSPGGQATAIALLMSLNITLLDDCARALTKATDTETE